MEGLSRLLKRQLKKSFGSMEEVPDGIWQFVQAVNQSYEHYESDRQLLERTMEISSKELTESNKKLVEDAKKHRLLIDTLKETVISVSPDVEMEDDDDLLVIVDILKSEISKRQVAEKAITESEELYRGIIENMELGMIQTNKDHIVIKVFDQFTKMTGWTTEDLLGKNATDILCLEEHKHITQEQGEKSKKGESSVYELPILCKNGEVKWTLLSGAPMYDTEGQMSGSVGIHFDITQRKAMETELVEAREKAERLLASRDQFLANVSHEIRTPMNAIIGMTGLMKETPLNNEQSEFINAVDISAKGLLVIINDILDMSKINSGNFTIESIEFNFDHLLKNLMAGIQVKAEEKGVSLQCSRDPRISRFLKLDPTRLNQVLINLCSNAIKFTDKGSVHLDIKFIKSHEGKDEIEFSVKDTGKGIAADKLGSIFKAFSQEDDTITRNYGGTGLGLAISSQLVQLFGSELKVSSKEGVGSRFYFTLSIPHGDQVVKQTSSNDDKDLSDVSVLLVEDNEINQLLATKLLGKWEANVQVANNGFEALEFLEREGFDLVLMDMQMPGMGGVECTEIIRADRQLEIPIIALTANAVKGEKEKCFKAGMNEYVSKPFNPDELYNKINQLLGREEKEKSSFDLQKIERLYGSDQKKINDFLMMIKSQLEGDLALLNAKIEEKDEGAVAFLAHKMKSTLDLIGNQEIRSQISKLEEDNILGPERSEELLEVRTAINNIAFEIDALVS